MLVAEARQLEDRLGLSPAAMRRLRWEIGESDVGAPRAVANINDYQDRTG